MDHSRGSCLSMVNDQDKCDSTAAKTKNMAEYFTLWRNYETWHTYRGPL